MLKISENIWSTNSDIFGFVVKLVDGYYEVYSYDECYKDLHFNEKDTNLKYLQSKYGFNDFQELRGEA